MSLKISFYLPIVSGTKTRGPWSQHYALFIKVFHWLALAYLELTEILLPINERIKGIYHHTLHCPILVCFGFLVSYFIFVGGYVHT